VLLLSVELNLMLLLLIESFFLASSSLASKPTSRDLWLCYIALFGMSHLYFLDHLPWETKVLLLIDYRRSLGLLLFILNRLRLMPLELVKFLLSQLKLPHHHFKNLKKLVENKDYFVGWR